MEIEVGLIHDVLHLNINFGEYVQMVMTVIVSLKNIKQAFV